MLKSILSGLAVLGVVAMASPAEAQSSYPFVDEAFEVPAELVTEDYRLRMLSIHDVVKDFDAVISSADILPETFPNWGGWPEGLTVEDNLIDLAWHHREFTNRTSFTYTVISLDESKVLGCVYIFPTRKTGYDADITLWAREAGQGSPADQALETAVRDWIAAEWDFENPAFPGRDMSWDEWEALPTSKR